MDYKVILARQLSRGVYQGKDGTPGPPGTARQKGDRGNDGLGGLTGPKGEQGLPSPARVPRVIVDLWNHLNSVNTVID